MPQVEFHTGVEAPLRDVIEAGTHEELVATSDRYRDVLKQAGVTAIVPETFEASLTLASHVLALLDFPMERVQESVQGVREERYGVLRGYFHGQRSRIEDTQGQALEVRHAVRLPDNARAVGQCLHDLDLARTGAEVRGGDLVQQQRLARALEVPDQALPGVAR